MSHGHPESDSTLLEGPDPAADFPGRGSKALRKGRIDGHHLQTLQQPDTPGAGEGSKCIPRPALQPFPKSPDPVPCHPPHGVMLKPWLGQLRAGFGPTERAECILEEFLEGHHRGNSWGHSGHKGVGKQSHHRPALREAPEMSPLPATPVSHLPRPRRMLSRRTDKHTPAASQARPENPNEAAFPNRENGGERKTEARNHKKNPAQPFPGH